MSTLDAMDAIFLEQQQATAMTSLFNDVERKKIDTKWRQLFIYLIKLQFQLQIIYYTG
jgi:hypothetical protein